MQNFCHLARKSKLLIPLQCVDREVVRDFAARGSGWRGVAGEPAAVLLQAAGGGRGILLVPGHRPGAADGRNQPRPGANPAESALPNRYLTSGPTSTSAW